MQGDLVVYILPSLMKKFQGNDMKRFIVRECGPASSGLKETSTIADTSHAKADSCRGVYK